MPMRKLIVILSIVIARPPVAPGWLAMSTQHARLTPALQCSNQRMMPLPFRRPANGADSIIRVGAWLVNQTKSDVLTYKTMLPQHHLG